MDEDQIYQAPLIKRIFAAVLDYIITFLLSIGFYMLIVNGAVDIGFHNLNYKIAQYELEEMSNLFDISKDSDGNFLEIKSLEYDLNKDDDYLRFVNAIKNYYFNYQDLENKSQAEFNKKYMFFDEKACESSIFSIESIDDPIENYVLLEKIKDVSTGKLVEKSDTEKYKEAIKNFFLDENKGAYNFALTEFTESERFVSILNELGAIERLEILIVVAVSTLIFMCIPILLNKNSETPFMHVLKIVFTDSYGYKVKWRHKIIRAIVTLLLNAASAYLFMIPLVVNMIVFFINSSKRSLVDLASEEIAIDKSCSIILEA